MSVSSGVRIVTRAQCVLQGKRIIPKYGRDGRCKICIGDRMIGASFFSRFCICLVMIGPELLATIESFARKFRHDFRRIIQDVKCVSMPML